MKRLFVIAIALACATEAVACASGDTLCEGFEATDRRQRQFDQDMQRIDDARRQSAAELSRDLDARERSSDQLFTDSLIMNLDRR